MKTDDLAPEGNSFSGGAEDVDAPVGNSDVDAPKGDSVDTADAHV